MPVPVTVGLLFLGFITVCVAVGVTVCLLIMRWQERKARR